MFSRISRALLPIGQAVYEARATLRTSAVPRPMQDALGVLSGLSSQAPRTAAGSAQPQRSPLPAPFPRQLRPGPMASGTFSVPIRPCQGKPLRGD
jgi:hypothetical protein